MKRLLNLLFPGHCLHCHKGGIGKPLLCPSCLEELRLLSPLGRCTVCFTEIPLSAGTCESCRKKRKAPCQVAGCFDRFGPGGSLLKGLGKLQFPDLVTTFAAYSVIQADLLGWTAPDLVMSLPLRRGSSTPLGKATAKLLDRPYSPALQRRFSVDPKYFVKKQWNIIDRSVLLLASSSLESEEVTEAAIALDARGCKLVRVIFLCA